MSLATVYRLTFDPDVYQGLRYAKPASELARNLWYFDAEPQAEIWDSPPITVERPRLRRPHIWHFGALAVLAFEEPIAKLLMPFLASAGELLPLVSTDGTRFSLLNITPATDCLDMELSILGPINWQLVFDESRLPADGMFKALHCERVHIFVVERADTASGISNPEASFRTAVEGNRLEGIEFETVWTSSTGSYPFSVFRI